VYVGGDLRHRIRIVQRVGGRIDRGFVRKSYEVEELVVMTSRCMSSFCAKNGLQTLTAGVGLALGGSGERQLRED